MVSENERMEDPKLVCHEAIEYAKGQISGLQGPASSLSIGSARATRDFRNDGDYFATTGTFFVTLERESVASIEVSFLDGILTIKESRTTSGYEGKGLNTALIAAALLHFRMPRLIVAELRWNAAEQYREARHTMDQWQAFERTHFFQACSRLGISHIIRSRSSTDQQYPTLALCRSEDAARLDPPNK